MARRIETDTIKLPAHWATAIINGDESGLSDDESKALAEWCEEFDRINPGWSITLENNCEPYFSQDMGDGSGLAGDVLDFTIYRITELEESADA